MTDQTIVAVYDTPAHAELAVQDLLQAGVPESAIHRHAQEGSYAGRATEPVARETEGHGFWSSLFGGEPDHDTAVYHQSVQSGSTAVTVRVPEEHAARVTSLLDSHAPIDLDERAGRYGLSRETSQTRTADLPRQAAGTTATERAVAPDRAVSSETGRDDATLRLSEETLSVGKRVVNRGTTRIRRFVVETPFEEQVRLRDERVTVERRPVTDGKTVGNADFSDKTITMTETAEEAVVAKSARVVEEITLRKEAAERTETVRDTVRREDVEIVKVPGETVAAPGGLGAADRKPAI